MSFLRGPGTSGSPDDRGVTSPALILGISLLTLALVVMINLATYQYGRGALRAAADQGARAGSRASASATTCEVRAEEALVAFLGGPLGEHVDVTCESDGAFVRATVTGTFRGWVELVPDRTFRFTATARKEQVP